MLGVLAANRRQRRSGSGRGCGRRGDRRRRERLYRFRDAARPVRRRAASRLLAEMRSLIKTAAQPAPPGSSSSPTRSAIPFVEEEQIAADRRGRSRIAARGEQDQARGADHRRHRQSAVQGKGQGRGGWIEDGSRRQAARAARPMDAAARLGRRRARQAPAAISTSISGAGRRWKVFDAGRSPPPAPDTDERASSASSPSRAFSTGPASRRCATTCAAPARTSG